MECNCKPAEAGKPLDALRNVLGIPLFTEFEWITDALRREGRLKMVGTLEHIAGRLAAHAEAAPREAPISKWCSLYAPASGYSKPKGGDAVGEVSTAMPHVGKAEGEHRASADSETSAEPAPTGKCVGHVDANGEVEWVSAAPAEGTLLYDRTWTEAEIGEGVRRGKAAFDAMHEPAPGLRDWPKGKGNWLIDFEFLTEFRGKLHESDPSQEALEEILLVARAALTAPVPK